MRLYGIGWFFLLLLSPGPIKLEPQITSTSSISIVPFPFDLFDSNEILNITLSGNIRTVFNDRGNNPQYHPLTFSYFTKDSSELSFPVNVKTRGHFRKDRSNCIYPPLMLNFEQSKQAAGSLFQGQNKLKLVMPCSSDDYVIKEWLVYKLYNLITPKSFKAKLVRVTIDEGGKKKKTPFYGILLEDEKQMAQRNHLLLIEKTLLRPQSMEINSFLTMAVFEYMIGNTDWSVQYLQNIKLLAKDESSIPITVPYDFDHSGLVNAPYAHPAEELQMSTVLERRYRGYCITDMKMFDETIALFNKLKNDFNSVIASCTLFNAKNVRSLTKYLDEFYTTINNPKEMKTAFGYPCDPNGTGNIIIKGLKED